MRVSQKLADCNRAWPETQRLFERPVEAFLGSFEVGWHDTVLSPLPGPAAVARVGGPLAAYIGRTLRVQADDRPPVFIYVAQRAYLSADLSLTRRAFLAAASLPEGSARMNVEVCS